MQGPNPIGVCPSHFSFQLPSLFGSFTQTGFFHMVTNQLPSVPLSNPHHQPSGIDTGADTGVDAEITKTKIKSSFPAKDMAGGRRVKKLFGRPEAAYPWTRAVSSSVL